MIHRASSNCDTRPDNITVDTIVLHATAFSTLNEVIEHFETESARVSAHYTIDRDGAIVSHVAEEMRAWHAGESQMKDGRKNVNDFSIGIELVNRNDGEDPYPAVQIEAMRDLIRGIVSRHPIRNIVTHYEIAIPTGRKSDPKGFQPGWIEGLLSTSGHGKHRLHKKHQFRMMLCGHKAVETGAACLFLMVQGQLAQATASHFLIASETGILTIFPLVGITWTRFARHYTNRWISALLVGVFAFLADAVIHRSHYPGEYSEAALTALAAAALSLIISFTPIGKHIDHLAETFR